MAKANFVKAAQKDIYENGKYVNYTSEKGKRKGQEVSKLDRTIPKDENDKVFIAKGDSYYWWQFMNGNKNFSKTAPKQSQLTQSNYLSQLYSIQEQIDDIDCSDPTDLPGIIDSIKDDLESLKDETESSLENMPDSLQSSPTGELLQERIDSLENAISEFENIDLDYEEKDDDELKELIADDEGIDSNDEDWDKDITEEKIAEKRSELEMEWIDEKLDEIRSISLE